jgi:hypothetical protein
MKRVVVAYFKVLSWNLPGGNEEKQRKSSARTGNLQVEV